MEIENIKIIKGINFLGVELNWVKKSKCLKCHGKRN